MRNAQTPAIACLPSDVLVNILNSVVQGPLDESSDVTPIPFVLSHVCRQWRELVFVMPCLWTNVCLSPKTTFDIENILNQSKRSLIKLSIIFPDSVPSSQFILKLKKILPLHSERIRGLFIYHCDCRRDEVFATIGILSCYPTTNLAVLEIMEDYDLYCYFYKRGVTRATPKPGLPWAQNLQRISMPGSWLHMSITGPRPFITTLQTDDAYLKKKSFKAMVDHMPALTTLILRNEHCVYQGNIDIDGPEPFILIPSLRLLRLEYYYHHNSPRSGGLCRCLPAKLILPKIEVVEFASKLSTGYLRYNFKKPQRETLLCPVECVAAQSLSYWNNPRAPLQKIRLENVIAPYGLLKGLRRSVDVEYVYNQAYFGPEDLKLLPPVLPTYYQNLTFDLSDWTPGFATRLFPGLSNMTGNVNLENVTVHLPSRVFTRLEPSVIKDHPLVLRCGATSRSSHNYESSDDLGHLARHEQHLYTGPGKRWEKDHPHRRSSPSPSMDGMEKKYTDDLCDSEDDSDDDI